MSDFTILYRAQDLNKMYQFLFKANRDTTSIQTEMSKLLPGLKEAMTSEELIEKVTGCSPEFVSKKLKEMQDMIDCEFLSEDDVCPMEFWALGDFTIDLVRERYKAEQAAKLAKWEEESEAYQAKVNDLKRRISWCDADIYYGDNAIAATDRKLVLVEELCKLTGYTPCEENY